jgi:PGF-CTERM protein
MYVYEPPAEQSGRAVEETDGGTSGPTDETADGGMDDPDRSNDEPVDTEASSADGPGFGVATGLAGLGGAGYVLKRRLAGDDEDAEE